jgi:hypothetical protein
VRRCGGKRRHAAAPLRPHFSRCRPSEQVRGPAGCLQRAARSPETGFGSLAGRGAGKAARGPAVGGGRARGRPADGRGARRAPPAPPREEGRFPYAGDVSAKPPVDMKDGYAIIGNQQRLHPQTRLPPPPESPRPSRATPSRPETCQGPSAAACLPDAAATPPSTPKPGTAGRYPDAPPPETAESAPGNPR